MRNFLFLLFLSLMFVGSGVYLINDFFYNKSQIEVNSSEILLELNSNSRDLDDNVKELVKNGTGNSNNLNYNSKNINKNNLSESLELKKQENWILLSNSSYKNDSIEEKNNSEGVEFDSIGTFSDSNNIENETELIIDEENYFNKNSSIIENNASLNNNCFEYLYVNGTEILNSCNLQVFLQGLSWFGFETETEVVHGLWEVSLDSLLNVVVDNGFNTLRIPLSIENIDNDPIPTSINFYENPDLKGLSSLEILDTLINKSCQRNIFIVLDNHRIYNTHISELWYEGNYSENDVVTNIQKIINRYKDYSCVIGFDIKNEPHGSITWNSGNSSTDWVYAVNTIGSKILEINPNILLFVNGIGNYPSKYPSFWGEHFEDLGDFNLPKRNLVFSPHTYGPSVYKQEYFDDSSFPENLREIWDYHFGFIMNEELGPLIVGEFGGKTTGEDWEWQNAFVDYLISKENYNFIYWSLNPNSRDIGGILLDDWKTIDVEKKKLLEKLMNKTPN